MSDRDKEYDEFLDVWNKSKGNRPTQRQSVPQARATTRTGRYLSHKRMSAKRRKARRRKIAIVSAVALAVLVLLIVLICKGCAGGKKDLSVLQGTWYYDQYTEYEFDGKGNGCMCIDKTNHYEFTYDIDGDTLKVDYALDYVTDCEYAFTVERDKLTLVGGNGTAEPGKIYELTKQE